MKILFSFFFVILMVFTLDVLADETLGSTRAPVGLEGVSLDEFESEDSIEKKRFILPPYYQEKTESTTFRTVFPFFYFNQREGKGAQRDLGILPFYWAHDKEGMKARVYFPFYWQFRGHEFNTDIVLQSYFARSETSWHAGVSPLFYLGADKEKDSSYQIILPPLYWNFKNSEGGFRYSLLYYDFRDKTGFARGFIPLYFSRKKFDRTTTTVLPPIFWYINDQLNNQDTAVLIPFFFKNRKTGWSAGMLPLIYLARDETWSRTMFMPFYYGSKVNNSRTNVFPLLLSYTKKDTGLNRGGIGPFFHWKNHDGDYLRMYTPLLWRYGNKWTFEKNIFAPPLFFRGSSPVMDKTMLGMVYWNFNEHHVKKTLSIAPLFAHHQNFAENSWRTWILPTFDFGKHEEGYHFRIHPTFYMGRNEDKKHFVIAPLLWNFKTSRDQSTVVFPLWWQFNNLEHQRLRRVGFPLWWQFDDNKRDNYSRVLFPLLWNFNNKGLNTRTFMTFPPVFWKVSDENSSRTGVLNVSVHRGENQGNRFWTFNLFPLFLVGKPPAPEGARWEFLHGLAGWRRQGSTKEMKVFWIPFTFSD